MKKKNNIFKPPRYIIKPFGGTFFIDSTINRNTPLLFFSPTGIFTTGPNSM